MQRETRYDGTQSVVQEPVTSGSEVHMFSPITKWRSISRRTTFVIAVALCACGLLGARPAMAARLHHVELNVADPQSAAAWYVEHMGGKAIGGKGAAVAFGPTTIRFAKAAQPVGGSVGTGLDHIGFGYADINAAIKRFAQTGVHIVSGVEQEGPIRYAFIKDPWGTLIEIVQDADLQGFHHIHLATTDGKQTIKWYSDMLGGQVGRYRGLIGGIRYGNLWVLVKGVKQPLAGTRGRAIDHVCIAVDDLDATADKLADKNVDFEPGDAPTSGPRRLFFMGPDRVRIELVALPSATSAAGRGDPGISTTRPQPAR